MAAKQAFKIPYIGIDHYNGVDLLVGEGGECSVVIQITNPVTRYSAAAAAFDEFHSLMINIVKIMGDGYLLQKQDILSKEKYPLKPAGEYLQQKYNAHFAGREYTRVRSYLTLTRQVKKGAFYVFDKKALRDFRQHVDKIMDILIAAKTAPVILKEGPTAAGIYAWQVQLPMLVTYQSASDTRKQNIILTMLIARRSTLESPKAIGIASIQVREAMTSTAT